MKRISVIIGILSIAMLMSSCASLYISSGKTAFDDMKYDESINLLEKGLSKKEDFAGRMSLARAYMGTSQYAKAAESYAIASVEPEMSDTDRIEYGKALMASENYTKAQEVFEAILVRDRGNEVVTALSSACKNIGSLKRDSALYSVKPLNIPGLRTIYSPMPYEDGILVSGEKVVSGAKDPYTGFSYTDLYYVKKDGSSWASPQAMTALNGNYHDGIACLSKDGKVMYFTRSNYDGKRLDKDATNVNNTQIYYSNKSAEGNWSEPKALPFNDENFMFAHPSLSSDGSTLYFSSNKSGGFGGMDLYKSTLQETNWSSPVNLGANVNTTGNEVFPFYQNKDTLYFSSDSHTTIGGQDILYSVNRSGDWSKPYHMSYPMNSPNDDFGIVFTESGSKGYLSSNRMGADQIYEFEIFNPVLTLKGLVTGIEDVMPIGGAKITIMNLTDGTEEVIYSDENGEFAYPLQPGKNYRVKIEDDGHFAQTKEISTIGKTSSEEIPLIFEMKQLIVSNPVDIGNPNGSGTGGNLDKDGEFAYAVPNIYWDYNKWDIRPDAEPYLNQLVKLFKDNPNLKVEIRSHCDSRGSYPFNDELSQKRATAVVDYVISKGVKRSMMISKGMGERKLVNKCKDGVECSEEEHQKNRRTEFLVISK